MARTATPHFFFRDKRNKTYHTKIVRDGVTFKRSWGRNKEEAQREHAKFMADFLEGKINPFDEQKIMVFQLAEMYLADVKRRIDHGQLKPDRLSAYGRAIQLLVDKFGRVQARNLSAKHLREFQRFLQDVRTKRGKRSKKKLKPRSINDYVDHIRTMYNWGRDEYDLPENDFRKVKSLSLGPKKPVYLTDKQLERLLSVCVDAKGNKTDMWEIIKTFARTGLRPSELANLRFRDIDLDAGPQGRGQIDLYEHKTDTRAKTPRPRTVPLFACVKDILFGRRGRALESCKSEEEVNDQLVFPNRAGNPHTRDTLRRRFDRIKKKAKLEKVKIRGKEHGVTIYKLRHTFATWARSRGVTVGKLAEIMGHTEQEMTELYAHMFTDHLHDAVEEIDDGD